MQSSKYIIVLSIPDSVGSGIERCRQELKKFSELPVQLPAHLEITPEFYWKENEEYLLVHEIKSCVQSCFSHSIDLGVPFLDKVKKLIGISYRNDPQLEVCRAHFQKIIPSESGVFAYPDFILAKEIKESQQNRALGKAQEMDCNLSFWGDKLSLYKLENGNWTCKYIFDLD